MIHLIAFGFVPAQRAQPPLRPTLVQSRAASYRRKGGPWDRVVDSTQNCPVSSHIYTVGGGRVAGWFIRMGAGWTRTDGKFTVKDIRDHFAKIEDTGYATVPESLADDLLALARALR
jgi:hypothetical protein